MATNKKLLAAAFLFATIFSLKAQTKYWVKFTDKNGTPYSLSNPEAFLSFGCIYRHQFYNIPYHVSDLPVNPDYIAQVAAVPNVTVMYASKWMNAVAVSVPNASVLLSINTLSCVASSSLANRYKSHIPESDATPLALQTIFPRTEQTTISNSYQYGYSYAQNHQVGVDCMHNLGARGQLITIAVLDDGFMNVDKINLFDTLRYHGLIKGTRDFVRGGTNVYDVGGHGTSVLSCMAACKPGYIIGSAPMSQYWLLRTEVSGPEHIIEEYNWIRGAEFADSVGARILTTSLGYTTFDNPAENHTFQTLDGKTAPMSIAATMAARKGMFVLNAAGNEGTNSSWGGRIAVPADADSICTVGAVDSLGTYATFSSRGKTYDGRIKPDLVAVGQAAWQSNSDGVCSFGNGTSFATPILAGAVACFMTAHYWEPHFNNIAILDTLKKIASKAANPDSLRGWGITNVCAIPFAVGLKENYQNSVEFSVYPNPSNSLINVNISKANYKINSIELLDVLGKSIQRSVPKNGEMNLSLNIAELPAGIYFVKINTSAGVGTKKIIKQ